MSKARRAGLIQCAILAGGFGITLGASAQEQTATPTDPDLPSATTAPRAPADDKAPVGQSVSPNPQGVVPSPQASEQGTSQGAPCARCGVAGCSGDCAAQHVGLFSIGKPTQYVPPETFWTVMVPPLPPPPLAPGAKPKPPQPWKGPFFENDFSYLDKPDNTIHNPFDFLKRIRPLGDAIVTDFGGEFRWQGKVEDNRRLLGEQNDYNLFRERLYMNTWFYNRFRFYGEVFFADSSMQTLPPLPTDIDHGDVNNLFGELRIVENEEDMGWLSFRYGWHEELSFGNQRLVSPLDWVNVRRSFDLIPHLVYRGNSWTADLFWSRPNIIRPRALDMPNYDQQFFGSYFTYRGAPNRLYDLYYLGLLSDKQDKMILNGETGNFQVHTLGLRWQGEQDNWLWEGEAAYQFGRHFDPLRKVDVARNAGMVTAGVGRRFADIFSKPELWFYFDYASGSNGSNNNYATFNQLFPLGHKFFGYMDIVGRQNIIDPNVSLKFFLSPRMNLLLWYHDFHLASSKDALYNAAGNPIRRDPTGRAGHYVGDELDIAINLFVNPNSDFQIGICNFFAGPFVERTAKTEAQAQGASFFYTQFTFRF